ncbi:MAG: hypothetical protein R3E09_15540 [Novosphingobium sp.]
MCSLACIVASLSGLLLSQTAFAAPNIAMDSAVYVERTGHGSMLHLEPADRLNRGDRVITILSWHRLGGDGGFTITNPLPNAIAYQANAREDEQVSVDGGRSWGRLGSLRIGSRLATPEDVTHVRWRIPASSVAKGRGNIAYSGIVR